MEKIKVENYISNNDEKTKKHPCFSCGSAHKYARMHLPIAPKCNISCNYCLRKYDCVNESRPGVTTEILSSKEAFSKYKIVKGKMPNLTVVGIAGPGDALANFDEVKETIKSIKEYDSNVTFCLSTNGLMLPFYCEEIIELGVSHVTITINGVDPSITSKIYKYVDYLGVTYTGVEGAKILLNNQLSGLKYLSDRGVICKVNIVMLKGINDNHIEEVVKKVKILGASITNIMQMIPVKGSVFEQMPLVSNVELMDLRKKCETYLPQMYHCKQCRADAIGTLDNDQSVKFANNIDSEKELRFAIASKNGKVVDLHFGHATDFYIYDYKNNMAVYKEKRSVEKYCNGKDENNEEIDKFEAAMKVLSDCNGIISLRIGNSPTNKFKSKGIDVFMTCNKVESAVEEAAKSILKGIEVENVLKL